MKNLETSGRTAFNRSKWLAAAITIICAIIAVLSALQIVGQEGDTLILALISAVSFAYLAFAAVLGKMLGW